MNKPTPDEVLAKLVARSTLTPDEIRSAAVDTLDFIMNTLDAGGRIYIALPTGRRWWAWKVGQLQINVPGMTVEL